jgi:hypothetical protein
VGTFLSHNECDGAIPNSQWNPTRRGATFMSQVRDELLTALEVRIVRFEKEPSDEYS